MEGIMAGVGWRCRLFGHVFRRVVGSNPVALTGADCEFSECIRFCGTPNPSFALREDADGEEHPVLRRVIWRQVFRPKFLKPTGDDLQRGRFTKQ